MRGGFSLALSAKAYRPRLQTKHLSRVAAINRFAALPRQRTPQGMRRKKLKVAARRGFFVDLKTLAAALTGRRFDLAGLAEFLGTPHRKLETDEHGGRVTMAYIHYAVRDVLVTLECFEALRQRYLRHGLTRTPQHRIYSGAGLGKAYLREMNVKPWRQTQTNCPPELIGKVLTAYYGGRSEVRLRRVVSQVLYCDVHAMYPTVNILMGLWRFVIAKGVTWHDATDEARQLLERVTLADLQRPKIWHKLAVIVKVLPQDDVFPVRAKYGDEQHDTIALNHLTSETPLWYTLADCIAAKLVTGSAPNILEAIAFEAGPMQEGLRPVAIAGNSEYLINPAKDDFFLRLIDLRSSVKARKRGASASQAETLEAEDAALKILANSMSYGIAMELNVQDLDKQVTMTCYGPGEAGFQVRVDKIEEPGAFFHPLLGTLITGAARLMLAMGERLILDAGLNWAFCDTDSIAIARPPHMPEAEFVERARNVQSWFDPLDPYEDGGPLLKIEDANYRLEDGKPTRTLQPLYCLAVSAKRYALFNLTSDGNPILRKASAHGLGHLLPPYGKDDAPASIPVPSVPLKEIGVERWQYDLWYRIVIAALEGHPDALDYSDVPGFDCPAVMRYTATNPSLLAWFDRLNAGKPYSEQVRPYNFLYLFLARRLPELPVDDLLSDPDPCVQKSRKRLPHMPRAVAPYHSDPIVAAENCIDRDTGEKVWPD
jgi:hypothetical protein